MKKLFFATLFSITAFIFPIQSNAQIPNYAYPNKADTLTAQEITEIKTTLAACADIMSFDINNYHYDTLFKYVLYTHKNFQQLTNLEPQSDDNSAESNGISLVNGDYIDFIMESVFSITPEKPTMDKLLERGFCYNNGYYYYTGGFDVEFSTKISDLVGVYDIGGNITYVIFTDTYREENTETYEQSFAILQKKNTHYSLLRLGMGEEALSEKELQNYAPFSPYRPGGINVGDTKKEAADNALLLPILLIILSVGIIGLFVCIFSLVRLKRK